MQRFFLLFFFFLSTVIFSKAQPVVIGDFTEEALNSMYKHQSGTRATTERSDTVDLLHFRVHLTVGDAADPTIGGFTTVEFRSKMDSINQLYLDLLQFNIDSVIQDNQPVTFSYGDSTTLIVNLLTTLHLNDSSAVTVYYHGHPQNDGTFGGVYFSTDYAYNVGMSLYDIPHNVGRMWHPCYDNFVERASYEYFITCDTARKALCNGDLIDSTFNNDGTITWHWKLDETIPTFIAGFAVGKFATIKWNFAGINGNVPVLLGAAAADTTKMKNSFAHLQDCFNIFEAHYGPYIWNKVGFNALPFSSGAMEHLGSIVYPLFACNGLFTYENLMAHELAHHWWGNEATPYDATEVWLKEGWAVYSELLFAEFEYGEPTYSQEVADNHEISVHYDHAFDGGYLPLSPMPLDITFGRTTYTKSADVVHTLRTYMGDSLFFHCLTNFVQSHAEQNYKSSDLRDYLSDCSGLDLTSFFDDWVFAPGFPHFSIDSVSSIDAGGGFYLTSVHIRQRLDHAPHFYHYVPLQITFMNSAQQFITETVNASGPCTIYQSMLNFHPAFICLDMNDKIQDAITDDYMTIKTTGNYNFIHGKMNLTVNAVGADSAFVRIEHNFVAPDALLTPIPNLHLSQERYWKVDGIIPDAFDASSVVSYNGTNYLPATTYNNGYLDPQLITNSEDSLVMMYRTGVGSNWQIEPDVTFNYTGSHTDKRGLITINHLKKGEYALAIYQHDKVDSLIEPVGDSCFTIVSVTSPAANNLFTVFPNPAQNNFMVKGTLEHEGWIEVYNLLGERIYYRQLAKGSVNITLDAHTWNNGIYLVKVSDSGRTVLLHKEVKAGDE